MDPAFPLGRCTDMHYDALVIGRGKVLSRLGISAAHVNVAGTPAKAVVGWLWGRDLTPGAAAAAPGFLPHRPMGIKPTGRC